MKFKGIFWLCILFLFLGTTLSCSFTMKRDSFSSTMDSVDVFISVADNSSALKVLKNTLKHANNPLHFLSIYKRYYKLGSVDLAQKTLLKGLKKFPDNEELITVYTWFLYNQNEFENAYEQAKKLSGTKYVSILSELDLKNATKKNVSVDFTAVEFAPVYSDAYISSKNQLWLQNAAICLASAGMYKEALAQASTLNVDNPIFWASVAYDARKYNAALNYLSKVKDESLSKQLLLADSYESLGSHEIAQENRFKLINNNYENVPPEVYFNSVRYAISINDSKFEYDCLNQLVSMYPNYIPGLYFYKDYALKCLEYPKEDQLALALRKAGFKSLEMQNFDDIPKVSMQQVKDILEKNLYIEKNPEIEALLFSYEIDPAVAPDLLVQEKIARLWLMLEQFDSSKGYPSELIDFVVPFLLKNGEIVAARSIFDKNLEVRFGTDSYADLIKQMSVKELEMAAYFAASGISKPVDYILSLHLYEFLVNDKTERFFNLAETSCYKPSVNVLINLAELYAGSRQFQKAKDTYSIAIGSTKTLKDKAEVLFRLANLQYEYGDIQEAMITLDYCLSIMPSHSKGRILKNKLGKK